MLPLVSRQPVHMTGIFIRTTSISVNTGTRVPGTVLRAILEERIFASVGQQGAVVRAAKMQSWAPYQTSHGNYVPVLVLRTC